MPNLNLSMDDLKIFSKIKGIRDFKNMSEERLISSINESVKKKKRKEFWWFKNRKDQNRF